MPLVVKITSESKEKGLFYASGVVTGADGTEKGKAKVLVRQADKGPRLELSAVGKSVILGNEVTEYRSYEGPTAEQAPELAKDVELTFCKLTYAI